jgi:hypothetical protein
MVRISSEEKKRHDARTLEGKVLHLEALVGTTVARNHGRVRNQGIVDTREWHQIGLELSQVDIECAIEAETRGDRADHLGDQTVQVLVTRAGNIQVATADIVDGFVVNQKGAVRVLNSAVGGQDGIVGLNNGSRHAGRGVDGELQLGFLAIFGRKTLQEQCTKARTGTTAKGVEDQEPLQRVAVVCSKLARNSVQSAACDGAYRQRDELDQPRYPRVPCQRCNDHEHLPCISPCSSCECNLRLTVVGGIFLSADQEFGVEELAVSASADLVNGLLQSA